jgi:hypothetical protein
MFTDTHVENYGPSWQMIGNLELLDPFVAQARESALKAIVLLTQDPHFSTSLQTFLPQECLFVTPFLLQTLKSQ